MIANFVCIDFNISVSGQRNLVIDGVLSRTAGFRDVYNEAVIPQISLEYPFVLRWVHTMQEGIVKLVEKILSVI